jgi:hypothetical protein
LRSLCASLKRAAWHELNAVLADVQIGRDGKVRFVWKAEPGELFRTAAALAALANGFRGQPVHLIPVRGAGEAAA